MPVIAHACSTVWPTSMTVSSLSRLRSSKAMIERAPLFNERFSTRSPQHSERGRFPRMNPPPLPLTTPYVWNMSETDPARVPVYLLIDGFEQACKRYYKVMNSTDRD